MSDANELPDYDYVDEEHKDEKNGAQDADGKKYVKSLSFNTSPSLLREQMIRC
jgi:hypothetical protein